MVIYSLLTTYLCDLLITYELGNALYKLFRFKKALQVTHLPDSHSK